MHIHILGICGTFMGGLALIARAMGHQVTGSDAGVYPPMSTQLNEQDIALFEGYSAKNLEQKPDLVVVGNALSRGNEELEAVLNKGIAYTSGAQWLAEHVLYQDKWTMAIAGTHGKTTTASLLAWILTHADKAPGFLIGGVADNLGLSAKLGKGKLFVVEADEYDTAFFDKRSKFIHYRPKTAILNNLEFDHADIFSDLEAMKLQFHHFLRTVPANGRLFINGDDNNLEHLLAMGCWSERRTFGLSSNHDWHVKTLNQDNTEFEIWQQDKCAGQVVWSMPGQHNMMNALAAIAAADHAGIPVAKSIEALAIFKGVKRRLEVTGVVNGITIYDDFAHHPTEISASLQAIRDQVGKARVIAVMEPRSNTMRMGIHQDTLAPALGVADQVHIVTTQALQWDIKGVAGKLGQSCTLSEDVDRAVEAIAKSALAGDHIVIMSNGGFGGIHQRLLDRLK